MYRLYLVRLFIICTILVSISVPPVCSQAASPADKWGFGVTTNYFLPLYNLYDRFDGGAQFGFKWSYLKDETTYDIQYFYSKFPSGKIEETEFQWIFDGLNYPSPAASSEIMFSGVSGNLRQPFKFNWDQFFPYWSIGAGFIYYEHKIENLVFPGQSVAPLNLSFTYSPDKENRTALSINFGGGVSYAVTSQLTLSLDLKYHVFFSYLRPMEAWYLEKVSPLQIFAVGLDLTYYPF